jgi:two-component system KDP operon response regulator KdpE
MAVRRTILVVEDDADIVALLSDLLGAAGYRVLTAGTATEAQRILRAFRAQLVIADALLPASGEGRWSVLDPILAAAGDAPVVLCSAHDPQEYADYAAHGCTAFLAKPFDMDELVALVASLLPDAPPGVAQGGSHALEQVL